MRTAGSRECGERRADPRRTATLWDRVPFVGHVEPRHQGAKRLSCSRSCIGLHREVSKTLTTTRGVGKFAQSLLLGVRQGGFCKERQLPRMNHLGEV